jgi:hypothetical protein
MGSSGERRTAGLSVVARPAMHQAMSSPCVPARRVDYGRQGITPARQVALGPPAAASMCRGQAIYANCVRTSPILLTEDQCGPFLALPRRPRACDALYPLSSTRDVHLTYRAKRPYWSCAPVPSGATASAQGAALPRGRGKRGAPSWFTGRSMKAYRGWPGRRRWRD